MKPKKNLEPIQNYDLFKNSMIPNIMPNMESRRPSLNFRSTKHKQELKQDAQNLYLNRTNLSSATIQQIIKISNNQYLKTLQTKESITANPYQVVKSTQGSTSIKVTPRSRLTGNLSYSQSLLNLDKMPSGSNPNGRALVMLKNRFAPPKKDRAIQTYYETPMSAKRTLRNIYTEDDLRKKSAEIKLKENLEFNQTPLMKFTLMNVKQLKSLIKKNRKYQPKCEVSMEEKKQNTPSKKESKDKLRIKTFFKDFWEPGQIYKNNEQSRSRNSSSRSIHHSSQMKERQKEEKKELVKTLKQGEVLFLKNPQRNVPWENKFRFSKTHYKKVFQFVDNKPLF